MARAAPQPPPANAGRGIWPLRSAQKKRWGRAESLRNAGFPEERKPALPCCRAIKTA